MTFFSLPNYILNKAVRPIFDAKSNYFFLTKYVSQNYANFKMLEIKSVGRPRP
jgi:hypothetical protein